MDNEAPECRHPAYLFVMNFEYQKSEAKNTSDSKNEHTDERKPHP